MEACYFLLNVPHHSSSFLEYCQALKKKKINSDQQESSKMKNEYGEFLLLLEKLYEAAPAVPFSFF